MPTKPKIIIANGEPIGRANLSRDIAALGYQVRATDDLSRVLEWVKNDVFQLVLLDVDLFDAQRNAFDVLQEICRKQPHCPVIALGGKNTVLSSLLAARFGAIDFYAKPYSFSQLASSIANALAKPKSNLLKPSMSQSVPLEGKSPAMQLVFRLTAKAAMSNHPLLIDGAGGSGKFLLAQIISRYGKAEKGVQCTLLPSTKITQIEQKLDQDNTGPGGVVLLRRLEHFSPDVQVWLCDWFDQNENHRNPMRVIATCSDQELLGDEPKSIMPDLLNRLNVLRIRMPDLHDRQEDIPDLALLFLGAASNYQMSISVPAQKMLHQLAWPGNVRQLKNVMTCAATMFDQSVIGTNELMELLEQPTPSNQPPSSFIANIALHLPQELELRRDARYPHLHQEILGAVERVLLQMVLEHVNYNQVQAARRLGINRNTLRKKILEYGLNNT
ncbi:MAG: sigma-54-dependent Fis family transcriptional regulator [Robiginitomaculum sp.]|nr:sigma-54-dependent Fis family transcriptional regulator [Robiginitomaculum sp.]